MPHDGREGTSPRHALESTAEEAVERLRIVTRGYEVSARGYIGAAQLLRYFEHMRWRVIWQSSRVPARDFMSVGVIRAQRLEVFEATGFDVEVELSIWLSRVGKTSLDFSHEMVRASDGVRLARSTATLVTLDGDRRPAEVHPAARQYVSSRDAARVERLDGPVPDSAFEHPVVIRPSDEDLQGHVNHARYADYVEDARFVCAAKGGYGNGSFDGPPRSMTLSYEDEARTGDPLRARTWLSTRAPGAIDFALVRGDGRVTTRARVGFDEPGAERKDEAR
ncbi:MAG TPA: hotdog domain-containing protein [Polyangiaceae bacterium]|nr:hotdog domain-containing protein [Polyangiaceae bacterium]